jgi:transcription elongation GreA/GreB family factor
MLQIEEENSKRQLWEAIRTRQLLDHIAPDHESATVQAGTLVRTDRGSYYIAIGIGKVTLDGETYFCVSVEAPLARALLGKLAGAEVMVNGTAHRIKELV